MGGLHRVCLRYHEVNMIEIYHTTGPVEGRLVYRTVVREYARLGTVQQATYRDDLTGIKILKYWACSKNEPKALEFDTEHMAVAYLHRNVF